MSDFWHRWLMAWIGSVVIFGIILVGASMEPTSYPIRLFFAFLSGPGELQLDAYMRFSLGLMGAITLGWSMTFLALFIAARQLAHEAARRVWMLATATILFWFVLDSALSVYTGFGRNAISNLILTVTFLIPVICSGVLRRSNAR